MLEQLLQLHECVRVAEPLSPGLLRQFCKQERTALATCVVAGHHHYIVLHKVLVVINEHFFIGVPATAGLAEHIFQFFDEGRGENGGFDCSGSEAELIQVFDIREGVADFGEQLEVLDVWLRTGLEEDEIGRHLLADAVYFWKTDILVVEGEKVKIDVFVFSLYDAAARVFPQVLVIIDAFLIILLCWLRLCFWIFPAVCDIVLEVFGDDEFLSCFGHNAVLFLLYDIVKLFGRDQLPNACRQHFDYQYQLLLYMQADELQTASQPSYLVVVFGPPASGKSTFAKHIHQSYQQYCHQHAVKMHSLLVSVDCLEEFLRNNTLADLQEVAGSGEGIEKVMKLQLKRALFVEQNWKESRQLVRQYLPTWLKTYRLVIIEDDLLLKSQRKHIRHIAEQLRLLYLQIFIDTPLQICLANLKIRQESEGNEYHLSAQKCKEVFSKFQIGMNPYSISVKPGQQPKWSQILQQVKVVTIEHPQLQERQTASEQNLGKDDVQNKIRKFVSEIISNKQLQKKYFKDADTKHVAAFMSVIKKKYSCKGKSLQGFLQFLKNETDSFI